MKIGKNLIRAAAAVLFALAAVVLLTHMNSGTNGAGSAGTAAAESTGAESGALSRTEAETEAESGALPRTEAETAGAAEGAETETGAETAGNTAEQDNLERSRELSDRYANFSPKKGGKIAGHGKQPAAVPTEEPKPAPVDPDLVWIASDLHYCSPAMTDYGEAFRTRLDWDDGKDEEDIETILDTWIDQVIAARPAVVLLTGDLSFDGETENHRILAEKLRRLTAEGIRPLVIPGNHDIGCDFWAASYSGDQKIPADTPMHADGFLDIYHEFGYDQAASRDPASLSYLYKLSDTRWFLMLDSAIYEPKNEVVGEIRQETLQWMAEILSEAAAAGVTVIPAAHHNLMDESRYYRTDCTLRNSAQVLKVLQKYDVPVWFSGHLHLQRIRKYLPEPGADPSDRVTEIVSGCFAMYPFPYGTLRFTEDGALDYKAETVAVSDAVQQNGLDEFRYVITRKKGTEIRGVPDYVKNNMAETYASLLGRYAAGIPVEETDFRSELGYRMMLKYMSGSSVLTDIDRMLKDTKEDARAVRIPLPEKKSGDGQADPATGESDPALQ